jgi:hypothetical protein
MMLPQLLQQDGGGAGTSPGLQKLLNRWQMPVQGQRQGQVPSLLQAKQPVMTAQTDAIGGIDVPPATGVGSNPVGGYGATGGGQNPFAGANPGGTIIGGPISPTTGQNPFAGATAGGTLGTQLPAGFTVGPTGQLVPVGGRFGGSGSGSPGGLGGGGGGLTGPQLGGYSLYGDGTGGGGGGRSWADMIDQGY